MTEPDTVKDLVFTFYQGELYQIVVNYDTYGTEGMTTGDFTEAISATYGPPVKLARTATPLADGYGGSQEVVAEWNDEMHRYVLICSAYGPSFRLVGTQQKLQNLG